QRSIGSHKGRFARLAVHRTSILHETGLKWPLLKRCALVIGLATVPLACSARVGAPLPADSQASGNLAVALTSTVDGSTYRLTGRFLILEQQDPEAEPLRV